MGERDRRRSERGFQWTRRVGSLLVLAGLLHLAWPAAGAAEGPMSYTASGTAYGVDVLVENESLPLGLDVQAAGPAASVLAGSTLGERSFASFPYPGETVAGVTGLLAGVFGVPLPPYPAYVVANTGDRPQDASFPGLTLQAEAAQQTTASRAVVGTGGSGFTSTARVDVSSDGEVAVAARTTGGFSLGGIVSVAALESSTTLTRSATGELEVSSDTRIGSIIVPGLALRIPETTPAVIPIPVPIPGFPQLPPLELPSIPLPLGGQVLTAPELGFQNGQFVVNLSIAGGRNAYAIPLDAVEDALAALGITFTFQEARPILDGAGDVIGVASPVVHLALAVPALPNNDYVNGPVNITVDVGRTEATIESRSADIAVPDAIDSSSDPFGVPSLGSDTPSFDSPSVSPSAPGLAAPTGGSDARELLRISLGRDATSIYLVLVGVALVGLSFAGALRTLGVRNQWT